MLDNCFYFTSKSQNLNGIYVINYFELNEHTHKGIDFKKCKNKL